jgi:phosphate transport system permease protein
VSVETARQSNRIAPRPRRKGGDRSFRLIVLGSALTLLALIVGLVVFLLVRSWPAIQHYGFWSFLTSSRWAPSEATVTSRHPNPYGIQQFIYGTVVTSAIALVLAVPVALGVALFLNELAPARMRGPLVTVTELLAMVPSVVYGFWGVFALVPAIRPMVGFLTRTLGAVPVIGIPFHGPFFGFSYFTAGIVLAIMILPIITALAREAIATVPVDEKEAAYAVGSTRWEMIRAVVLPHSRSGLVAASFLGLGRALGETIAVTMVIGNRVLDRGTSLFGQGATLASAIVNEFTEANRPFHLASLFVLGFWLMVLTFVVNAAGRLLILRREVKR